MIFFNYLKTVHCVSDNFAEKYSVFLAQGNESDRLINFLTSNVFRILCQVKDGDISCFLINNTLKP